MDCVDDVVHEDDGNVIEVPLEECGIIENRVLDKLHVREVEKGTLDNLARDLTQVATRLAEQRQGRSGHIPTLRRRG